jgi:hypothetical protein
LTNAKLRMSLFELVPIIVFGTLSQKGVSHVWVSFATFIFNFCKLIDNPISYIDKSLAIIAWSYFIIGTFADLGFLDLVFRYKWSNNDVRGMFQCLFVFFNEVVPFSTTSMASSSASLVHLPLVIKKITFINFFLFFY